MARRALGKRLAELTGKKVDRKLGKKVNLRGQGYHYYFTYIPATRPQFSPWLDMSMKDMYNMKYKTNGGIAKEINAFNDVMDEFNNNNYKFKFNDKEYILAGKGGASPYIAEEWGVPDGVLKTDFDFKLASLDSTEVVDIGKALTEMGDGDADIIKFMQESKIQITGQISPEKYTKYSKEYYENLRYGRHTNMSSFDIQKSIYERTPEQIEFDNNWDEHLKQEGLKGKRALQQHFDAIRVEARYKEERRAKRQADLEAAFNGTTEPEIITNPVNTTETVQTTKQARAAAAANAGPEVMQGEAIDPVTKTKSKLGIKNGEGNYRFPPQETGPMSFPKFKKDSEGNYFNARNVVATNEAAEQLVREEMADEASKNLRKSAFKNFGHVMNIGFAISDYKDAKEAGHSTAGAITRAGMEFVKGEVLGGWYPVAMLAKSVPKLAVSAAEGLNTMSREMNSMSRRQLFGDAQFQDTQQLATMRQSGMELAKMSQYNLQQALMGNEAEHLHRL